MADAEEDYSSLPITERATHKIWKVRKQAYEDITKEFERSASEQDACFRTWTSEASLWKGIVADSNVAAQQDGVAALCAFLQYGGHQACLRARPHCVQSLVEKGLVATKAVTKAKSLEALLLFVELDVPAPIVDELVPFLSHKMPKIIAASANALWMIYKSFGAKICDPKPVLKQLPRLFGHGDKNVRAEATNIAIELYKWLKDGIKPIFYNDLKPVQQKELDEAFEKVKAEVPKQERLLRSQQAAAAVAAANDDGGMEEEQEEEEAVETDAFDLFEPVNVIPKVPKDFYELINSSKWKERKETLDGLYAAVNVPRIKAEDFSEITRMLAKSMKDANIAVVIVAANSVEALAKGLRKDFARYKSNVLAPMLERLKEKKQTVADALGTALDAVFMCTSLTDVLEDTLEHLKHKNPQVKLETLRFHTRCLKETRVPPTKAEVKSITEVITKILADSSEVTRIAAAEAMGTLMKIMGERAMNPYVDPLDDIRKVKIKEFFDAAVVKAKDKPPPPPPPPAAVASKGAAAKKKVFGAKAIVKKPVAKAPSPVEEPPTPAKKGPTSKLAAPKTSGLTLKKKMPGPPGALASPKRISSLLDEEPPAPVPKLSVGRGGLTGRNLQAPVVARTLEPERSTQNGMSTAEKEELAELRSKVESLSAQVVSDAGERSRIMQELNELRMQNANLIEEQTRDVLSMKSTETQALRYRSDLRDAEETVEKKQREIDRLKRELARFSRSQSPGPTETSEAYRDSFNGASTARETMASPQHGLNAPLDRTASMGRNSKRLSYASTTSYSHEERENGNGSRSNSRLGSQYGGMDRSGALSPGANSARGGTETAEPIESWKRAAEVTSALKQRIEQMKARQNNHLRGGT